MAATENDIRGWLSRGKEEGATHVIVACDTFSWEDYPVYVRPGQEITEEVAKYNRKNMQKIMEVYNLAQDIESQLREWKPGVGGAWHL